MCNACINLIYDILISPLPLDHELRDHIQFKSLERCAVEVAHCFYRAVRDFPVYPEFFRKEIQRPLLGVKLRIRIPDESLDKYEYEEIIWNRFYEECPVWAHELQHAIDTCIDYSIGRLCTDKNMLVKHFLMGILHKILLHVPAAHKEHTIKAPLIEYKSLGPVELCKLIEIRQKARLA